MTTNLETRVFQSVELRIDGEGSNLRLSGHAAVFNSLSLDMGFREFIRPGAFTNTLKKNPDVRFLIEHKGLPLARTKSGTLKLKEDKYGLHFTANLDAEDPDVRSIVSKVKRKDMDQMSFAFRAVNDDWNVKDGVEFRELIELDLNDGDVSVVTYGAYPNTDVATRSYDRWKQETHPRTPLIPSGIRLLAMRNRTL